MPAGAGRFVTFEGGEGTGKSTQVALLARRLRAAGQQVLTTRDGIPLKVSLARALRPRCRWEGPLRRPPSAPGSRRVAGEGKGESWKGQSEDT